MNKGPNEILFARRLGRLLGSHIDLAESIKILAGACTRKEKLFFKQLSADIASGTTLAASLAKNKSVEPITIALVRIGEESGSLAASLMLLCEELGKRQALKKKVIAALIYPASIASATLALSGFLVLYIFPKIEPIFLSLKIKLPWTTRLLIFSSNLITHHPIIICFAIALGIAGPYVTMQKFKDAKAKLENFYLKIPIVSRIVCYSMVSTLARRLGILLASGMPIDASLALVSETMRYAPYRAACDYISEHVSRGIQLSECLKKYPLLFPQLAIDTFRIGELTGSLSEACKNTAEYYELEVDDLMKAISGALEPILMVSMGCIVGFIALSIITPLYALTQNIG